MHAHIARRFEVHIAIEQALEPVRHLAGRLQPCVVRAMIRGEEVAGGLVMGADVPDEPIDQLRFDSVAPPDPAMIDEMRQIVTIGLCEQSVGELLPMQFHRVGAVCPERPQTT